MRQETRDMMGNYCMIQPVLYLSQYSCLNTHISKLNTQ